MEKKEYILVIGIILIIAVIFYAIYSYFQPNALTQEEAEQIVIDFYDKGNVNCEIHSSVQKGDMWEVEAKTSLKDPVAFDISSVILVTVDSRTKEIECIEDDGLKLCGDELRERINEFS